MPLKSPPSLYQTAVVKGSLQTGSILTTSHITVVIMDKTQTSDPFDSLYILYIYIEYKFYT